jgi:tetratricopeptide (TPR) repeat protein
VEEVDYARATGALQRAVTIARHEQDSTLEVWALTYGAAVDAYHLHWSEILRKSQQAAQLAHQIGEPAAVGVLHWAVLASLILGDLPSAIQKARVGLATQVRDCYSLSSMLWINEFVSEFQGDWEAARHYSDRGLAVAPSDQRLLCTRAVLEYQVGEFSQGEVYLGRLLESIFQTPPELTLSYAIQAIVIPAVAQISSIADAQISSIADRLAAAETAAQVILSAPAAVPFFARLARTGLALLAQLRGDRAAAREQYDALVPQRGTMSSLLIADDRLLGLLSTTQDRLDQAVVHFEDALAFCRQARYQAELAWTCYNYAETLLQRGYPGDHARAMVLLDESLTISCELGMHPLAKRVATLQEQSQSQGLTVAYPDGLSQQEAVTQEYELKIIQLRAQRDILQGLIIRAIDRPSKVSLNLAQSGGMIAHEGSSINIEQSLNHLEELEKAIEAAPAQTFSEIVKQEAKKIVGDAIRDVAKGQVKEAAEKVVTLSTKLGPIVTPSVLEYFRSFLGS